MRMVEPGYSLIELVVALALLSMIALATASGLHFGVRVWERSEAGISQAKRLSAAQTTLRTVLAHTLPRLKGDHLTFSGHSKEMSFDAVPPNAFARYGAARVTLQVVRVGPQQELHLSMAPLREQATQRNAILMTGLDDLHFEYLDAADRSATWLSSWQDRSHLPVAVRIASSNPSRWPPLVIRLTIAQTATCLLDPESLTCRQT